MKDLLLFNKFACKQGFNSCNNWTNVGTFIQILNIYCRFKKKILALGKSNTLIGCVTVAVHVVLFVNRTMTVTVYEPELVYICAAVVRVSEAPSPKVQEVFEMVPLEVTLNITELPKQTLYDDGVILHVCASALKKARKLKIKMKRCSLVLFISDAMYTIDA